MTSPLPNPSAQVDLEVTLPLTSNSSTTNLAPRTACLPPLLARWLLALLSRLESYLSGDAISHLRTLARACLETLTELKAIRDTRVGSSRDTPAWEREEMMGCWMIWEMIVAGPWAQRDLRVEEEAVFSTLR